MATNQGLQSDLVGLIEPSAIAKFGADKAASTLAASFTAFVKTLLSEASAVLTPAGAEEPSLFKAGAIDTAAIPNPDTYVSVIYAPRAISFTDTDTSSSLGGLITITAPQVKSGIISYNLYFGGSTLASAKGMLIGNVLSSVEPLSYTLDSGTVLPSGSTHLWVYPVTSGGELPLATSSQITNVLMQIPGMVTTLTATGFNGRIDLSWTAVAGATSYKIYYSNGSTVTTSNSSLTAIINPYSHFGTTNFLQYNYRIAAVNASGEGPLSTVSASATGSGVHASWVGLLVASPEELAVPWSTDPRAGSFSTAGDEAIRKASSIALDEEGDVMYVVNTNGQRVTKRKISDGSVLGSIGKVNAVSTGTCPSSGVTPGWCTGGSFGSSTQDGGFDYPSSVVIDKGRDSMWIGNNQHISKYTLSTGAFVGSVGGVYAAIGGSTCPAAGGVAQSWCTGAEFRNSSPLKDGEFEGVSDMKLDTVSGTLYVTDYSNRVVKMNAVTGAFIGAIGKITTLNPGSTCVTGYRDNVAATGWCTGGEFEYGDWDGEFDEPCAIAIDQPGNRIYVSTCSGDAISRIDMTTGAFLGKIGASDGLGADSDCQLSPDDAVLGWCKDFEPSDDDNDLDGGFYEPEAIAVDLDNDKLYVGHYYDNKVCQHTLSTGAFIGCQGNNSNGVGGYAATQSWLTDTNMNRADSSGSYLGGFEEVDSIISGRDGYLYIGDANNRILRFSKQ
ncbi:MAG: hypothetical protein EOP06_03975 [Proteobacteria bacterium]|nr:MAG: hypothetical protein EOP06_03975 [Pseudomonadota bacterium]